MMTPWLQWTVMLTRRRMASAAHRKLRCVMAATMMPWTAATMAECRTGAMPPMKHVAAVVVASTGMALAVVKWMV